MRLLILLIVFLISKIAFGQEEMKENEIGSMTRFSQYFYERYKHPESARMKKIEGELIVNFYVNNKGEMVADRIKLISGVCAECDSLALKIIKETPKGLTGHRNVMETFPFILSYRKVTVSKE